MNCSARAANIIAAGFPDNVSAPVQYGPVIKSTLVYLTQQQLLPTARTTSAARPRWTLVEHPAGIQGRCRA